MANTSRGRVGRGVNARFSTSQLVLTDQQMGQRMDRLMDKVSNRVAFYHTFCRAPRRYDFYARVSSFPIRAFALVCDCSIWVLRIAKVGFFFSPSLPNVE